MISAQQPTDSPRSSTSADSPHDSAAADQTHWHGFTQMDGYVPLQIASADGCYLHTVDGRRLFDGAASLWCNAHGHRNPRIDQAIRDQLDRVSHVTTLGMCSDVTAQLAEKLAQITPGDLQHTFFSSDGSSAVEASIKMAFQYWQQKENPQPEKTQYLALGHAYHGDTTGSVALGGIDYFHKLFGPLLFSPLRGPTPCSYRLPAGVDASEACDHYAGQIEAIMAEHHKTLAAVVMEPLVQGAAGMVTHPTGFLTRIRQLCDRYDVLLICDEVAVGFGRTGKMFACDHESVTPDILTLGKGLTGGYLPLAATVARPKIFAAFLAERHAAKQFFHGHTFGGNPLACAAAMASIELFEAAGFMEQISRRGDLLRQLLSPLERHPNVGDIRGRGLMQAVELVANKTSGQPLPTDRETGLRVCDESTRRGVWIRPLGDNVILVPPLISTDDQIRELAETTIRSIETVLPN